jgi:hypothetical protein
MAHRGCKTPSRRYPCGQAEGFHRAVERDRSPARDLVQQIDPPLIGRESTDLEDQVIGLVTPDVQHAPQTGPAMSFAPADPVTDRIVPMAKAWFNTSPAVFATETSGSNHRIGGKRIAAPCSHIGAITD